jgi:phospholipid/cholesterol/gamma-HCH transport system substrate-binding protein
MENRSHALMTGIFTITLLIATVVISLWLNRDRVERVPYLMETTRSVSGLNPQAPIRYRGLDVGRVSAISFDQHVPGLIVVELSINPDAPITKSTYATLGFQGVTGIAFVQLNDDSIEPVRMHSSREKLARIELRASIFDKLESHGSLILTQAEELTGRLSAFLTPENQKIMLSTFENVSKTAREYETIPKQLAPTLAQLPAITGQTQQALTALTTVSHHATILVKNLNGFATTLQAPNNPLNTLTSTAQEMSTSVGAIAGGVELEALPRVNALTDEARSAVRTLNRTINTFTEQPQSILFGAPGLTPGPGEAGFVAPDK